MGVRYSKLLVIIMFCYCFLNGNSERKSLAEISKEMNLAVNEKIACINLILQNNPRAVLRRFAKTFELDAKSNSLFCLDPTKG